MRYLTPTDCYTILLSIKWSSSLIQLLYFTASADASDNQLFPLPLPLCLTEGIYSSFSAVLYNAHDFNGKTDKQFMPQEY